MPLEFSAQSKQRIERVLSRYPNKQAALLPVLHIAQDEFGHLPDPVVELVAKTVDVSPAHVFGVVTFYTMFHRALDDLRRRWREEQKASGAQSTLHGVGPAPGAKV
jgi:NADH:ubiquinone oxidoreductase subunit E